MNWGNRLLIVFIVFGTGMGYLVYRSTHTKFDLVETDYYATELRYQQEIDASKNASKLSAPVSVQQGNSGVTIQFPEEMKSKKLEGTILFYCSYNRSLDRSFAVQTNSDGMQLIPTEKIYSGNYSVKINWKESGTKYYAEKQLSVL